jgi:hypothetical protein
MKIRKTNVKPKLFLTEKWNQIVKTFELQINETNECNVIVEDGELDILIQHFIGYLSKLTIKYGFDYTVEGIHLDIWKRRIWTLTENAGLLPQIDDIDYH